MTTSAFSTLALFVLFSLSLLVSCRVPLRVKNSQDCVIVDVQTLGEYPTTVNRVRLISSVNETIWEIKSKSRVPQIWTLTFRPRSNSVDLAEPSQGEYAVVTPQNSKTFELKRQTDYQIQVWGENPESRPTAATLRFSDRAEP